MAVRHRGAKDGGSSTLAREAQMMADQKFCPVSFGIEPTPPGRPLANNKPLAADPHKDYLLSPSIRGPLISKCAVSLSVCFLELLVHSAQKEKF